MAQLPGVRAFVIKPRKVREAKVREAIAAAREARKAGIVIIDMINFGNGTRRQAGMGRGFSHWEGRQEKRNTYRWAKHSPRFIHRWRRPAQKPRYKDLRVQTHRDFFLAGLE